MSVGLLARTNRGVKDAQCKGRSVRSTTPVLESCLLASIFVLAHAKVREWLTSKRYLLRGHSVILATLALRTEY